MIEENEIEENVLEEFENNEVETENEITNEKIYKEEFQEYQVPKSRENIFTQKVGMFEFIFFLILAFAIGVFLGIKWAKKIKAKLVK